MICNCFFFLQRVLVTEFIDGIKINEMDELLKMGCSLKDIDSKLFQAFGEQIFQSGFVHADPHPGNGKIVYNCKHNFFKIKLINISH